jgi:predicted nucleic acid-binding protein
LVNLVIDASVAVKWFVEEASSNEAYALINDSHRLFAPDLLKLEVGNYALRAVRRGTLARSVADAAMVRLTLPVIDLVATSELIDDAYVIARQHGGSLYDATYISLAKGLRAELVTADLQMIAVARKAKVKARLIG